MIDLEGLAHRFANALYGDSEMDETAKAKIEYGFSLTMGIGLTFILTMAPAALLGTFSFTFVLMISALVTRIFSGGAHCSSYTRCLFLSLLIFVLGGVILKLLAGNAPLWLIALIFGSLILAAVTCNFCRQKAFSLPIALLGTVALAVGLLLKDQLLTVMLPAAMGICIQTLMTTPLGQRFVEKTDFWLKQVIK